MSDAVTEWEQSHMSKLGKRGITPRFEAVSLHGRAAISCFYHSPVGECYLNSIELESGRVFRFA